MEANLDLGGRHLRRVLPGQHRDLRLVVQHARALEQPRHGDDVHLLGEYHHVQRQSPAPLRRLLRDGRLARDSQPADQEHAVLRLPDPGKGARAGNPGPELHAAVAADPVRHVLGGQLHLSLVRHVRDPVVPVAGLEAIQARIGQLSSCNRCHWYPCWECRFIRSASSFARPGGCAK